MLVVVCHVKPKLPYLCVWPTGLLYGSTLPGIGAIWITSPPECYKHSTALDVSCKNSCLTVLRVLVFTQQEMIG